ncbi:hypothetical protein LXL04_005414 [Taraxacum kok-saghyz]
MIADINSFVNRLRRDCKTGLLNRTNNGYYCLLTGLNYSTSFGSQTCNRIQLQHNSITTVFNYSRIQLQHIQFLSITTNQTCPKFLKTKGIFIKTYDDKIFCIRTFYGDGDEQGMAIDLFSSIASLGND